MTTSLQTFYPKISPDIPWDVRQHLQLLYQKIDNHAQAITQIHSTSTTTTVQEIIHQSSSGGGGGGGGSTLPGLGGVNNQTGQTAYTTQSSDAGILIVLSDASPVAVTLNSGVTVPWMAFFANQGAGVVTVTPQTGVINYAGNPGAASMPLRGGYCCLIVFDGSGWWAWTEPIVPVDTPAIAHQWISAYNALTGAFTQVQPTFADIAGTAAPSQLPTPTLTTLGGVKANTPVASEWIRDIDTTGTPQLSQPAFTDIAGTAAPTQLPAPTVTTLGGVKANAPVTSQWIREIDTTGTPLLSQPAFTDISGVAAVAQIPALPESQITGLTADLAAKAPIASPTFTGVVTQPNPPVLTAATVATAATAGAATALPATPAGYLEISINGTTYKVPYYAV